jgi:hypothetical protein
MWIRKVRIERIGAGGEPVPCPIAWIDNFAMRNFTNDAVFDDTLPVADGTLEVGTKIALDRMREAMQDWFRRKGYLTKDETLHVEEEPW